MLKELTNFTQNLEVPLASKLFSTIFLFKIKKKSFINKIAIKHKNHKKKYDRKISIDKRNNYNMIHKNYFH